MYDVAVLGVGSMGAFTCLELARRGLSVIGIDQFTPPHERGSHSGETRVYREAYAEHEDYVPLAVLAGQLWDQYGKEAGHSLLHRCGQMSVGRPESELLSGVLRSAALHGIAVTSLSRTELATRYPMLQVANDEIGVLEPAAGWVDVNASLEYALGATVHSGGELRLNTAVDHWETKGDSVEIRLASGEIVQATRLIICAGAWSSTMLPALHLPLRVVRKVLAWARPRPELAGAAERLPVLMFAGKLLYTFPAKNGLFKMAIHTTDQEARINPDQLSPAEDSDFDEVIGEAALHLGPMFGDMGELRSRITASKTCLYTMTPDEHFILDRIDSAPVWYAAGFSGHGFKFAPAIGRVMAEMCLGLPTSAPVAFLSSRRFTQPAPPMPPIA